MNIQKGKTYKTKNGGSVRIVADDRESYNGKHWVGLYATENGEWVLTYDNVGNAYVFDTIKPELSIEPETRKWWFCTFLGYADGNRIDFRAWNADIYSRDDVRKLAKENKLKDFRITLVEQTEDV
jgi:hypothetical protein